MTTDYDKQQWQAEQSARDAAIEKQREREAKTRERAARNAKRKLERLHLKLKEAGELTEWEEEFSTSVTERLDQFGSAFRDLEKGRPSDALSFAQKRVVASLKKKAKTKKPVDEDDNENSEEKNSRTSFKRGNGFKSKKPKFTPRVRHIEEDFEPKPVKPVRPQPFIPQFAPEAPQLQKPSQLQRPKKPFLRIVSNDD
ncbi:MAG: hypothetical protein ACPGVT_08705 [Maricaulaceae bacterium]